MKYRKKPVVIEAMQYLPDGNYRGLLKWIDPSIGSHGMPRCSEGHFWLRPKEDWFGLMIPTLKGEMMARPGDWIIKGVNGEFYPCKPDIFEKTYEPVDDTPTAQRGRA